ncbi:MAG: LemA family protein [Geobacteraceae bacterium]|nr:LemA family protein [Geobacteraceae bacterium]
MNAVTIIIIGVLALIFLFAIAVLVTYNGFVRSRLRTREAWSAIDVQLKRRASLVPSLVETVKGYAGHERETLEEVTRARGALQTANGTAETAVANNMLTQALGRLFALVENYPQLRASENFMALQKELSDIEEKIAYARQFYNQNALAYNASIQVFPQSVIAGIFNFQPAEFFAAEESREDVQVDFSRSEARK